MLLTEDTAAATPNEEMDAEMEGSMSAENMAKSMTAGGIPKNFRQQADMEAFYRFVHENDLREEALAILDQVRAQKKLAKTVKARVKH